MKLAKSIIAVLLIVASFNCTIFATEDTKFSVDLGRKKSITIKTDNNMKSSIFIAYRVGDGRESTTIHFDSMNDLDFLIKPDMSQPMILLNSYGGREVVTIVLSQKQFEDIEYKTEK